MKREDVYVQKDTCPNCGTLLDSATISQGKQCKPVVGDLSVCIKCATLLEFDENLKLKRCLSEHFNRLDMDTKLQIKLIQTEILKDKN